MKSDRRNHFDVPFHLGRDSWGHDRVAHERRRCAVVLEALRRPHYASVIEVGCAGGVLSEHLRHRCDRFLGLDLSERALALAGRRLAHVNDMALRQVRVPDRWPRRTADLVLLSEVLHALSREELRRLASCMDRSLMPGAEVVIMTRAWPKGKGLSALEAVRLFIDALSRQRPLAVTRHAAGEGHVHLTLECRASEGTGRTLIP